MPPRDSHEREREARRRYQAAIAAALEALRRAYEGFDRFSAEIDLHIEQARAADAGFTRHPLHGPARDTTPRPSIPSTARRTGWALSPAPQA